MLFLDGVYEVDSEGGTGKFHAIETPNTSEMQGLLHRISERIALLLEREGYLERDTQEVSLMHPCILIFNTIRSYLTLNINALQY